jgi:HPt (histidine-containing phosphotransfer) domain-containing protein
LPRLTEAQRAELDGLRRSYEAELPEKLVLVAEAAEALRRGGWKLSDLEALYHLIHRLAGSAAMYGFDSVSRSAAELETWALAALDTGLSDARRDELPPLLGALRQALGTPSRKRLRRRDSSPR